MRSGFRPHDRDRMTESMEGVLDGLLGHFGGVLGCNKRGLYGSPVNRWSIKQTPNGTKLDRRSTGGVPRPLGKPRSIPRKFNTRSQQDTKGGRRRT